MRRVFNAAWDELVASASIHAKPARADRTRETLALKVIALVQKGGRDFEMLKRQALRQIAGWRSASHGGDFHLLIWPDSDLVGLRKAKRLGLV
jgi:hypothetical protein